ncbi:MAG: twin-arginine translocase TatA/TatE family subunit [Muribaculaceae bacterium]|nr:twin-arginine translocase TatA/TatE family subunit [Muribaculaceae bacterium]
MLGTTELLLLGGLALLIFGGKKVPELMRGLGQGVKEFKKGMSDCDDVMTSNNEALLSNEENVNNIPLEEKDCSNNVEQK